MLVKCHLFLLLSWLSQCMGRGPHHPHGHHAEHKHHHYKPSSSDSLTSDTKLLHDTKHLEEDSKVLTAEALAKMTPEELEFHYFSSHDYDGNSKLDGLEMLKAVYHTIEHSFPEEHEDDSIEPEATDMEAFVAIVDRTLLTDDTDGDGYISYLEYRAARINNTDDRTPRIVNQNYNPYLGDVKVRHNCRHLKIILLSAMVVILLYSMLLPHYYTNVYEDHVQYTILKRIEYNFET